MYLPPLLNADTPYQPKYYIHCPAQVQYKVMQKYDAERDRERERDLYTYVVNPIDIISYNHTYA